MKWLLRLGCLVVVAFGVGLGYVGIQEFSDAQPAGEPFEVAVGFQVVAPPQTEVPATVYLTIDTTQDRSYVLIGFPESAIKRAWDLRLTWPLGVDKVRDNNPEGLFRSQPLDQSQVNVDTCHLLGQNCLNISGIVERNEAFQTVPSSCDSTGSFDYGQSVELVQLVFAPLVTQEKQDWSRTNIALPMTLPAGSAFSDMSDPLPSQMTPKFDIPKTSVCEQYSVAKADTEITDTAANSLFKSQSVAYWDFLNDIALTPISLSVRSTDAYKTANKFIVGAGLAFTIGIGFFPQPQLGPGWPRIRRRRRPAESNTADEAQDQRANQEQGTLPIFTTPASNAEFPSPREEPRDGPDAQSPPATSQEATGADLADQLSVDLAQSVSPVADENPEDAEDAAGD